MKKSKLKEIIREEIQKINERRMKVNKNFKFKDGDMIFAKNKWGAFGEKDNDIVWATGKGGEEMEIKIDDIEFIER